jgi:hypothetical protein
MQQIDRFFRLFLVPGTGHCSGGTGTTNFGNQNVASLLVDPDHNLLSALDRWVEMGVAPDKIIALTLVMTLAELHSQRSSRENLPRLASASSPRKYGCTREPRVRVLGLEHRERPTPVVGRG